MAHERYDRALRLPHRRHDRSAYRKRIREISNSKRLEKENGKGRCGTFMRRSGISIFHPIDLAKPIFQIFEIFFPRFNCGARCPLSLQKIKNLNIATEKYFPKNREVFFIRL